MIEQLVVTRGILDKSGKDIVRAELVGKGENPNLAWAVLQAVLVDLSKRGDPYDNNIRINPANT
jgi:hypothetical protein